MKTVPAKILNGVLLNIIKDHKIYDISYEINSRKIRNKIPLPNPEAVSWSSGSTIIYNYNLLDISDLPSLPYGSPGSFLNTNGFGNIYEDTNDSGAAGLVYEYENILTAASARRTLVSYSANNVPGSFQIALAGNGTMSFGGGNHGDYTLFELSNMTQCYIKYETENQSTGELTIRYTSVSLTSYGGRFVVSADSAVSAPELQLSAEELITEIKSEKEVQ